MKKVLTLVMPDVNAGEAANLPPEIEIIGYGGGAPLSEAVKKVKGRYIIIADGDMECNVTAEFFAELEKLSADIVKFDRGYAFKTAIVKGVPAKLCTDKFRAEFYSAPDCKKLVTLSGHEFFGGAASAGKDGGYSEEEEARLLETLEAFKKYKAKFTKDVYSFTFDMMRARLERFYVSALLAVKEGALPPERLKEFDLKLKENIVLYLAVEKRFADVNLKKLRENGFKTGYFTYRKLKKL